MRNVYSIGKICCCSATAMEMRNCVLEVSLWMQFGFPNWRLSQKHFSIQSNDHSAWWLVYTAMSSNYLLPSLCSLVKLSLTEPSSLLLTRTWRTLQPIFSIGFRFHLIHPPMMVNEETHRWWSNPGSRDVMWNLLLMRLYATSYKYRFMRQMEFVINAGNSTSKMALRLLTEVYRCSDTGGRAHGTNLRMHSELVLISPQNGITQPWMWQNCPRRLFTTRQWFATECSVRLVDGFVLVFGC